VKKEKISSIEEDLPYQFVIKIVKNRNNLPAKSYYFLTHYLQIIWICGDIQILFRIYRL